MDHLAHRQIVKLKPIGALFWVVKQHNYAFLDYHDAMLGGDEIIPPPPLAIIEDAIFYTRPDDAGNTYPISHRPIEDSDFTGWTIDDLEIVGRWTGTDTGYVFEMDKEV